MPSYDGTTTWRSMGTEITLPIDHAFAWRETTPGPSAKTGRRRDQFGAELPAKRRGARPDLPPHSVSRRQSGTARALKESGARAFAVEARFVKPARPKFGGGVPSQ